MPRVARTTVATASVALATVASLALSGLRSAGWNVRSNAPRRPSAAQQNWVKATGLAAPAALAVVGSQKLGQKALARGPSGWWPEPQAVIFMATFFSLLGFTMTGPTLPALRAHFGLSAAQAGLFSSAFPLGSLTAMLIFPALSDALGRKPLLVASYLGVGLGMLMQALLMHLSFSQFLVCRAMTGALAWASTVEKAYLADVTSHAGLPRVMAQRETAATIAFIVGPSFGGLVVASAGLTSTLFVEALSSLLAGALVLLLLPQSDKGHKGAQIESAKVPWAPVAAMMLVGCLYNLGWSFFDGFFPLLCAERFHLTAPLIGSIQTLLAVVVLLTTACLHTPAVRLLGLRRTAAVGLLLIASGLLLVGLASALGLALLGVMLYALGTPLFSPSAAALLAALAPAGRRGSVLGLGSAANAVARIVAPTAAGRLYGSSPGCAFSIIGLAVAGGSMVLFTRGSGRE